MLDAQIKKYGDYYFNTEEGRRQSVRRYYYQGEKFDSSWELAFWIYHKDNNISIIHNEKKLFSYKSDGKIKWIVPDFIVGKTIIEIKGDHFKKSLSFNRDWPDKEACLKNHNVKIIWNDGIKKYLKYVRDKYGDNYLRQFKKKSKNDYKRKIIDIKTIREVFELRNKNIKVSYSCLSCNDQVITSVSNVQHHPDFLCKTCRKKQLEVRTQAVNNC